MTIDNNPKRFFQLLILQLIYIILYIIYIIYNILLLYGLIPISFFSYCQLSIVIIVIGITFP